MKALQNGKRTASTGTVKEPKNLKKTASKKKQKIDLINGMVFSEYDVWPILAELNNRKN